MEESDVFKIKDDDDSGQELGRYFPSGIFMMLQLTSAGIIFM